MRRRGFAAIAAAAAMATLTLAVTASAQTTPVPTSRFTSPRTAVGGQPIFIRSIDPCPVVAGAYQYAQAGFVPQLQPAGAPPGELTESTATDLRPDGSWEVTISAPNDFPAGTTKSFSIHAQCIRVWDPYFVPDPDATTSTTRPTVSTQDYVFRVLYVTAPPDEGVQAAADEAAADDDGDATTTTTVVTTTTEPEIEAAAHDSASYDSASFDAGADAGTVKTWVDDEAARAAEARAELARRGVDTSGMSDDEVLLAAPVSTHRPVADGGVPWWSFVLATMLAVGAVLAWGTRRERSLAE